MVGFDGDGEPVFLWPFGRMRKGPFTIVGFLGSKHANFNLGLWRRDILPSIGEHEIRCILQKLKNVDLVALCNQPLSWDGARNPFALLPNQLSADISACLMLPQASAPAIDAVLSTSMRSRLRNKERKLQKLPGYRYLRATTVEDIDRLFDRFLKRNHMAAQGLRNVFAEPGVADFLRAACHSKLPNGRPLIEIHALEADGELLALFGSLVDGYRSSSMFNTYTFGENARYSPGLILIGHIINDCGARGIQSFDIGVGRAHYKSFFCREPEPLFDTFIGLTARGRIAASLSHRLFEQAHDQAESRAVGRRTVLAPDARTTRGSIGGCPFVSDGLPIKPGQSRRMTVTPLRVPHPSRDQPEARPERSR